MLARLAVKNLAVVAESEVRFGPGLSVLTGETGAGKSLLIGALKLILGERVGADRIRQGAETARVEALFEVPALHPVHALLDDAGLPECEFDGGDGDADSPERRAELTLIRELSAKAGGGARARVFINHGAAAVGVLETVAEPLIRIVGQHEHTRLADPDRQRQVLDEFMADSAGDGALVASVAAAWTRWQELRARFETLTKTESDRLARLDYLRFQLDELDRVDPKPGEEDELAQKRDRLRHVEKLREALTAAVGAVSDSDRAAEPAVGVAIRELSRVTRFDPTLEPFVAELESARAILADTSQSLARALAGLDADPAALEEVEDRLATLHQLARKHGGTLDAVLAARDRLGSEVATLEGAASEVESLGPAVIQAEKEFTATAKKLTAARTVAAKQLQARAESEVRLLGMTHARFEVTVDDAPPSRHGTDRIVFRFSANPGEALKPLSQVASGGELSRVTLALHTALRAADAFAALVFDEVDAGIGGGVAEVVGRKLQEISRTGAGGRQVIVVTHLAQIAACADHHYRVSKKTDGERTWSVIEKLDAAARTGEIARMLGGMELTDLTLAHAAELLARGQAETGAKAPAGSTSVHQPVASRATRSRRT